MARLVLLSEGFTGRTYELKVETTTVGRVEDNAFQILDASVSSHHAEILLKGNDVFIRDLDSTNGTFISGQPVKEGILKPGQILRLGTIEMRLETGDPGAPKKQKMDQTLVIPQGVKMDELEGTRTPVDLKTNPAFSKKSNSGSKIFIIIMAIIAVILIGFLVFVVARGAK